MCETHESKTSLFAKVPMSLWRDRSWIWMTSAWCIITGSCGAWCLTAFWWVSWMYQKCTNPGGSATMSRKHSQKHSKRLLSRSDRQLVAEGHNVNIDRILGFAETGASLSCNWTPHEPSTALGHQSAVDTHRRSHLLLSPRLQGVRWANAQGHLATVLLWFWVLFWTQYIGIERHWMFMNSYQEIPWNTNGLKPFWSCWSSQEPTCLATLSAMQGTRFPPRFPPSLMGSGLNLDRSAAGESQGKGRWGPSPAHHGVLASFPCAGCVWKRDSIWQMMINFGILLYVKGLVGSGIKCGKRGIDRYPFVSLGHFSY